MATTLSPSLKPSSEAKTEYPWAMAELLGAGNVPRHMEAANKLYATHMVQAINLNFRVSAAAVNAQRRSPGQSSSSPVNYSGTVVQSGRRRVKQYFAVKCTLQVMLSFMAFCAITAYIVSDM